MKSPGQATGRVPTMDPNSIAFTVFLGLLAALPALSIDLSAPTLALLPDVLGTSKLLAGLTLSLFMCGFALGQLFGGALSDRRGRKPVLMLGLVIYSLAGVACALSSSGPAMVASRLVQGVGAGMCAVLAFAMVQDLFQGAVARSKRAYVIMILGAAPIMAPALGTVVLAFAGWRAVHAVLAIGGVMLLAVARLRVAESRPARLPPVDPYGARPQRLWRDSRFVYAGAN